MISAICFEYELTIAFAKRHSHPAAVYRHALSRIARFLSIYVHAAPISRRYRCNWVNGIGGIIEEARIDAEVIRSVFHRGVFNKKHSASRRFSVSKSHPIGSWRNCGSHSEPWNSVSIFTPVSINKRTMGVPRGLKTNRESPYRGTCSIKFFAAIQSRDLPLIGSAHDAESWLKNGPRLFIFLARRSTDGDGLRKLREPAQAKGGRVFIKMIPVGNQNFRAASAADWNPQFQPLSR